MRRSMVGGLSALLVLLMAAQASAAVKLTSLVHLDGPVHVAHMGDTRLFIVEQPGRIRIYNRSTGAVLPTPFLDIHEKVLVGGEQGMLSMAFHPDYASNGLFYVYYTDLDSDIVIERYRVSSNPNVADPASARSLLMIEHPEDNHNGGQLQIGRDGFLYIGTGDGGGGGDPNCLSQRRDVLLGKLLRLDVRQNLNQAPYYGIPASNPFGASGDPSGAIPDEIWALGLRNPWRFSFDRTTGDLFIADVGQADWEEINLQRATTPGGLNFGWKVMEGRHCYDRGMCPSYVPTCNSSQLTLPIHEYDHMSGDCSITGGFMYRGSRVPELSGRYVFGDFCSATIRGLRETSPGTWTRETLFQAPPEGLVTFGEDADGELYVVNGGTLYKIESTSPPVARVPASSPASLWAFALAMMALAGALLRGRAKA